MLRTAFLTATRRAGYARYRVSLSPCWFQNGLVHPANDEAHRKDRGRRRPMPEAPRMVLLPARQFSATAGDGRGDEKVTMGERRSRASKAAKQGARSAGAMFRTYGPVFVGTYLSVYAATLGGIFLGIESGALDPGFVLSQVSSNTEEAKSTVQVIIEFLDHYPWTRPAVPFLERNPELANLGVAWVATKFTEPVRLAITFPIVPRVSRAIGWTGPNNDDDDEGSGDGTGTEAGVPAGRSKEN